MTRDIAPSVGNRHRCPLGDVQHIEPGTLRECPTCGRWWRSVQTYRYWTESEWFPVRCWQWRLRRLIRRTVTTGEWTEVGE